MLSKRKIGFILILLVVSAFLWYHFTTAEYGTVWHGFCAIPERGDYSVCCREGEESSDCFEDKIIECGKDVRVMVRLEVEEDEEYILCIDRHTMLNDTNYEYFYDNNERVIECVAVDKSRSLFYWFGKIPYKRGKYTFVDAYKLPKNLGIGLAYEEIRQNYEEILQNLDSYELMMSARGDIICEEVQQ